MVKISELKPGNLVVVEYEDRRWEGIVTDVNREDKEVGVDTGVQEFWFRLEHVYPVPMSDAALFKLGFSKEFLENGMVKYIRGPFRMLVKDDGKFAPLEIWYREDRRYFNEPIYIHDLQNKYLEMTKVDLNLV